jgi:hypothetical protein
MLILPSLNSTFRGCYNQLEKIQAARDFQGGSRAILLG